MVLSSTPHHLLWWSNWQKKLLGLMCQFKLFNECWSPPIKRTKMMFDKHSIPMMPNLLIVHEVDFTIKEINIDLGKFVDYNHHYDLMEHMTYIIHVVRAHGLVIKDANGTNDHVSLFWSSYFCSSSSLLFIGAIIMCIWH